MSLLLTESCDIGLFRWSVNGLVSTTDNGGVGKFGSFIINSAISNFDNKITQQFRELTNPDNIRSIRLSFWMKANGQLDSDSNFILLESVKDKCGVALGVNNKGQFYSGYLTESSIWQGKFAEENIAQPNIIDGHYHYVEIDGLWDNNNTSYVRIYVDNFLHINYSANNTKEGKCWAHADKITFGNLKGVDLQIDDIIVWDDLGSSYTGYKGSTKLKTTKALSVEEYAKKNVKKTFNIENNGSVLGGIITARANSEEGKSSSLEIFANIANKEQKSKEYTFVSDAPQTIKMVVDTSGEDSSKIAIGYKRTQ